jgi:hypothetical protein
MRSYLTLLAPAAMFVQHSVAAATNATTLQIPIFGYGDSMKLEASIVGVTNDVTTMTFACPTNPPSESCYVHPHETLTIGPSTYRHVYSDESDPSDKFSGTQDCDIMGGVRTITSQYFTTAGPSPTAVLRVVNGICDQVFENQLSPASSFVKTFNERNPGVLLDMVVTAGAEHLAAAAAAAATGATPTASMKAAAITATTGVKIAGVVAAQTVTVSAAPTHTGSAGRLGIEVALGAVAVGVAGILAM